MSSTSLSITAIDDERLALDLLTDYVERTPGLELLGCYQSPVKALEGMRTSPPDLLLLDIQMPGLSGLNLLRSLARPPVTIFTTAYPGFALEAYELDVVDYLLKPIPFERFLRAISKAREVLHPGASNSSNEEVLLVKVDGKLIRIPHTDIQYLEGMREYVRLHCDSGRYLVLERMHALEERLPANRFFRLHKSYLAAKKRIRSLEGNQVEVAGEWLPVSRKRRDELLREVFGLEK
ncbi:MAG: LytTR family DNA-binding domain-containing protein [Bacteroidota bacterium]